MKDILRPPKPLETRLLKRSPGYKSTWGRQNLRQTRYNCAQLTATCSDEAERTCVCYTDTVECRHLIFWPGSQRHNPSRIGRFLAELVPLCKCESIHIYSYGAPNNAWKPVPEAVISIKPIFWRYRWSLTRKRNFHSHLTSKRQRA